jgi:hypothetical protein
MQPFACGKNSMTGDSKLGSTALAEKNSSFLQRLERNILTPVPAVPDSVKIDTAIIAGRFRFEWPK